MPQPKADRRRKRLPQVGETFAGRRVVAVLGDGVRLLEPIEGPQSFTQEECRETVRAVVEARRSAA